MSFVKQAVGITTASTSWTKRRGSKRPDVSKVVSVSIILMTLSPSTPQVCVSVSAIDSVVSIAAITCTGLQMNCVIRLPERARDFFLLQILQTRSPAPSLKSAASFRRRRSCVGVQPFSEVKVVVIKRVRCAISECWFVKSVVNNMAVRNNTIFFTFDPASPRITAHDVHEWLHEVIRLQEHKVQTIQIDGIKRQVYVKLIDKDYMASIIRSTGGTGTYLHHTGRYPMWRSQLQVWDIKNCESPIYRQKWWTTH